MSQESFTIAELCERFNVTKRTIYYYMSIGILPPAGRRGKGNTYSEDFAKQLEYVLRFRGKFKLAQIPMSVSESFGFQKVGEHSVVTMRLMCDSTTFLQYAFDSTINESAKMGLNRSDLLSHSSGEALIVLFPVNDMQYNQLKSFIDGLRVVSKTHNGGVHFKVYIAQEPFMMIAESSVNE
jgi:DNA-binding transcriptional MerR regulator